MWLIIQIALGIALGYAIIRNYRLLLGWGKRLGAITLFVLVAVAIIWGLTAGVEAGNDYMMSSPEAARALSTIGTVIVACFAIGMFLVGFAGLGALLDRFVPLYRSDSVARWPAKALTAVLGVAFIFTGAVWELPLFTDTWVGDFYLGVDHWSRSNGYADAGTMALVIATYQWPWLVWLLINSVSRARPESLKGDSAAPSTGT